MCILIQASAEARDMALGLYERDPVHPLNPDMVCGLSNQSMYRRRDLTNHCSLATCVQRKTLELTGKSRTRGAVQPDVARICNVPHKNFFIVVKVCWS